MTATYSITALHDEVHNDPAHLYAGVAAGDLGALETILNSRSGPGSGLVPNDPILGSAFLELIDPTELQSLSLPQKSDLQLYTSAERVAIGDGDFQSWIRGLFSVGSAPNTNAAMAAAATRAGSRAEVLWGVSVPLSDLQQAQPF